MRKSDTSFYVDGGVFNNNPLNIAREMANYVDRRGSVFARLQPHGDRREFIFIWPTDITDEAKVDSKKVADR